MLYFNPQATLSASSGNNNVIVVSSPSGFPIELESLILIVDLRSLTRDFSNNNYNRFVQLKFREKGVLDWSLLAEISCLNKGTIYRQDLLRYLTVNSEFRIAPLHEMAIAMAGLPLTGTDTIQAFGCGYQPDI